MASPQSEPQYVAVDSSDAGPTILVNGVVGRRIRVLAFLLVGAGTVIGTLTSSDEVDGDYGVALTGAMPLAANGNLTGSFNPVGWCETAVGEHLVLDLSAGVAVSGMLVYTLV